MMYEDKYENHFLSIECGRARFADFSTYTLNALLAAGQPAALAALAPPLRTALADFTGAVATRTTRGGSAQAATATEDQQWQLLRAFIAETDVKTLQPAFFGNAEGLAAIYPAKLGGLTQASKGTRLLKFRAYTEALEAATATLGAAPGAAARQLLETYQAVAAAKDGDQSGVAGLIKQLGPKAEALGWALWAVHCAALAAYARTPRQAAALFNYGLLPTKKRPSKRKPV